jgi:hypothetical protein
MKYKITLSFLIFSFINILGQNNDSTIQLLEPLDWDIMSCGKSKIGQKEKCTLIILNETDKAIQACWISNTNLIGKPKFGFVGARQSKTINIEADDYWIICDINNNALGVYKTLPGKNKIIINDSNFANSRKLPTNIKDETAPGTISGGSIIEEQAAYDVIHYDIKMEILPDIKYIKSTTTITAIVTDMLNDFVFDLDTCLKVQNVCLEKDGNKVFMNTKLQQGKYWCKLPQHSNKGALSGRFFMA